MNPTIYEAPPNLLKTYKIWVDGDTDVYIEAHDFLYTPEGVLEIYLNDETIAVFKKWESIQLDE